MTPALRFEDVSFAYGPTPVLRGLSFALQPGDAVALFGRNGAGKTTVARLTAGLERADRGVVWVGDWDAATRPPEVLAHRVATVFQHADQQLFARTVRADVAFGPRALGLAGREALERAESALTELGLEALADQHPYDVLPAARKLVALAGALALAPRLLVLDEPTAGLDRHQRALVGRVVRARADAGGAVLCSTHDLDFAAETLDRALVLADGARGYDGPLAELVRSPERLAAWGLDEPALARLSRVLDLPGLPIRLDGIAPRLAECCAAPNGPYIGDSHV